MSKCIFTEDVIGIEAILHAKNKGNLYTGPKKGDLKDPLDTLPHVCAAFLLDV